MVQSKKKIAQSMFATSRQNNEDKILSYCEHSIRKPYILLHQ